MTKDIVCLSAVTVAIVSLAASIGAAFVILMTKGPIADYSGPTELTLLWFVACVVALVTVERK